MANNIGKIEQILKKSISIRTHISKPSCNENKKLGMKTFKSTNSWINDNGKILHAII